MCSTISERQQRISEKAHPEVVNVNYRGAHKQIYLMRNYYIAAEAW